MGKEDVLKKSESALIAKKIFIESMSFQRNEVQSGMLHLTQSSIGKSVEQITDNEYKCSISLKMTTEEDAASLEVVVSGIFEFNAELTDEQKQIIVTKNTMAILFPYLRAQVTLITAQPDMEPVVLPAININALLQNIEA